MNNLKGQYDFGVKLKWNPAYIAPPGGGPEFSACRSCVNFGHDIEPDGDGNKHFYFCNLVFKGFGIAKGIDKDCAACEKFEQRKRGVVPHTTGKK